MVLSTNAKSFYASCMQNLGSAPPQNIISLDRQHTDPEEGCNPHGSLCHKLCYYPQTLKGSVLSCANFFFFFKQIAMPKPLL